MSAFLEKFFWEINIDTRNLIRRTPVTKWMSNMEMLQHLII